MEGYDFVRRLERAGPTTCVHTPPLVTSSRRFAGRHPMAIIGRWLKLYAYYHLGIAPETLVRIYDRDNGVALGGRDEAPGLASPRGIEPLFPA